MKQFEFKMVPQPDMAVEAVELLNRLGQEGWSLAAKDYGSFIMQREIQEQRRLKPVFVSDQPVRRV